MRILDKVGRSFVNPPSLLRHGEPVFARRRRLCSSPSCDKDCLESDFDRQRLVNIAPQLIAQFFEATDAF
jgi:hypothetical protein